MSVYVCVCEVTEIAPRLFHIFHPHKWLPV